MNEEIFLHIPTEWIDIKDFLLLKLSTMSENLLTDCIAGCSGSNREYLSCWFMFQSAVADYENTTYIDSEGIEHREITKTAKTLIHFICTKLGLGENIDFSEDFTNDFN